MQLGQLRKIHPELMELGYHVIAVSPDRPEKVAAVSKGTDIEYTLLSDTKLEAARGFGVAYHASDEMVARLASFDIDIEAASGEKHHLLPVPSVFILDTEGRIRFEYVNPDHKVRIDPDTLLAAARASVSRKK